MQRFFPSLAIIALLAVAPGVALAEDGGRGPAGGAYMSSYSTPPAQDRAQPSTPPASAFAVQREPEPRPAERRRRAR